jgi:hypothetical protein
MPLDATILRNRWQTMPGIQQLSYKVQGAGTAVPVDGCRKRPLTNNEKALAASIGINSTDCIWLLPAMNLSGNVPKPGDTVTDSTNQTWRIEGRVTSAGLESDFKCLAVRNR